MLDDRKKAILHAVVTRYVATAQPVGSSHITGSPGVDVSPATVRAEMVQLERDGFLAQPHTSAGRVPTDKGYRCFVDDLGGQSELRAAQSRQVREFFDNVHGELEQMLDATSKLLSRLTGFAAVVVEPPHSDAVVRSIQLVALGGGVTLLIVVFSDGAIEKRAIEQGSAMTDAQLGEASAWLTAFARGQTLRALAAFGLDAGGPFARAGASGERERAGEEAPADREVVTACSEALRSLGAGHESVEPEQVFVGGAARMAGAFDGVETVRSVLGFLEQQYALVGVLRGLLDRGLSVAIGSEHGVSQLAGCSVVVAPFALCGQPVGAVGLLGPTRMDYPLAIAAVAAVGEQLTDRLGVE